MRIGIVAKPGLADARDTLRALAAWLRERGHEAVWSPEAAILLDGLDASVRERDALPGGCDLVVVLGGDGTLLAMADRIARGSDDVPILGVNFGSLGFLTEITRPELFAALDDVVSGRATLDERMMLTAAVQRGAESAHQTVVLNDVVFTRTALSRIIDLAVWVGDQFVTTVRADGLILASPTGSTAYNLAAGGPTVSWRVRCFVLSFIALHHLDSRPLVIGAEEQLTVTNSALIGDVDVQADGQRIGGLRPGRSITVGLGGSEVHLATFPEASFFRRYREKFGRP